MRRAPAFWLKGTDSMKVLWTAFCTLAHLALRLASVALVLPWALRLLEIPSAFDRWLHGLSHWELLATAALAYAGSFLFLRFTMTRQEFMDLLEDR